MEYMFTPVRGKIQRACAVHSTPVQADKVPVTINKTPSRRQTDTGCRCEILKKLKLDLYNDFPVYASPRLEIVRKRVLSNNCRAALRKEDAARHQKKEKILRVKRKAMKEKDRLLAQRYAELSKKMAAILGSPDSPVRTVSRRKTVIVTAV